MKHRIRTADPYRDLAVIDARAPRFNQLVIGSSALLAFVLDWWPLLGVLAAQLAIGLALGRRWCLPCVAWFELLQPVLGEGPVEDSRPPRFANRIGVAVLTSATVAHAVGAHALGWALGLLVAALALAAALTGLCAGCELYTLAARLRGVRALDVRQIDVQELGAHHGGPAVVQFSHPLCSACRELERRLTAEGRTVVSVDVSARPDLARRYGVALVPTAFEIDASGTVLARI